MEKVKGVFCELFPLSLKSNRRIRRSRPKRKDSEKESDKRISEPGMFPAYFRYELPEAIFSYVEMASLRHRLEKTTNQTAREAVFLETLDSISKASLKRDDFLRKLADLAKSIPEPLAKSLGLAAVKASAKYAYDVMSAFGEAGYVLRMILLIALRLPHSEKIAFLQECIECFLLMAFLAYDVSHAFFAFDLKPEVRRRKTMLYWIRRIASELHAVPRFHLRHVALAFDSACFTLLTN